jgi:hypothetical protein
MSARPVDQHRLSRECGIDRQEMLDFIAVLVSAGAVAVHPPLRSDFLRKRVHSRRDVPDAGTAWGFLPWLRNWCGAQALSNRGPSHG